MMFASLLGEMAVFAASNDDSPGGLLALGPAAGGALYWALWRYYRNADKSHSFEQETRIEARPVTGREAKVGDNNGTRNSSISGKNSSTHRQRVQRHS